MEKNNIITFDYTYLMYRKLWINDRWRFSGELVKLKIKCSMGKASNDEFKRLDAMNRVVEENNHKWLD